MFETWECSLYIMTYIYMYKMQVNHGIFFKVIIVWSFDWCMRRQAFNSDIGNLPPRWGGWQVCYSWHRWPLIGTPDSEVCVSHLVCLWRPSQTPACGPPIRPSQSVAGWPLVHWRHPVDTIGTTLNQHFSFKITLLFELYYVTRVFQLIWAVRMS